MASSLAEEQRAKRLAQGMQRLRLEQGLERLNARASIKATPIPERDIAANLREFNVGVAGSLGLPVDAVGAIARVSGLSETMQFLGVPEQFVPGVRGRQVGGAQSIQQAFADIGASPEPGLEGDDIPRAHEDTRQ